MLTIEFIFGGEPVGFKRPINNGRVTFNDPRYHLYKKSLATAILAANRKAFQVAPPVGTKERSLYLNTNRYKLQVRAYCSHDRSDVDNLAKVVMDALQDCGMIADDRQISKLISEKFVDRVYPRIAFKLTQTQSLEQFKLAIGRDA